MKPPTFLLSSERSGSNLMRVMMDSHPEFSAPHSPHLIKTFVPILAQYGPLEEAEHRKQLADDIEQVVRVQLRAWAFLPGAAQVVERAETPTFAGLLSALYQLAAEHDGKSRAFIKDNGAIPYAAQVALMFPHSKFVYLVRDPRDVALSWKKSPGHPGGVKAAAQMWNLEQSQCLQFLSLVADRDRVCVIHYEDLVTRPEPTLKRITDHLGMEFEPQMLTFFEGSEARTSAEAAIGWENLVRPVMSDNCGKYRHELSTREQRTVERIAGLPLQQLGYQLHFPPQRYGGESDLGGKLYRAARTAIQQLLRGQDGIRELQQRTKRLQGLRDVTQRVSQQAPVWRQAESSASTSGPTS